MKKNKRVLVALSGGVDSAIAAYLLVKDGFDVEAIFMRNWDSLINNDILGNNNDLKDICPQEQDYNDAINIAKKLGIKLQRIDFVKEYWDLVFKEFLAMLEKGLTPNPDILCNKEIKFNLLTDYAKKNNYDYLATGHYCRIKKIKGKNRLFLADDDFKDQTYFLGALSLEQLSNILFPLSGIKKTKVKKIAKELDLAIINKKESTGICFIGERNYPQFLSNYLTPKPGKIVNINNQEIGEHMGLFNYTIGQRKGLGIGTINGQDGPWYVVGKDHQNNTLIIDNNPQSELLYSNKAYLDNLVLRKDIKEKINCKIRFRHQGKLIKGTLYNVEKPYITYKDYRAVAPGQVAVLYKNKECFGSAQIKEVYSNGIKRLC